MATAAEIAGWEEVKKADAEVDAGDEKQRVATSTAREGSASEVNIFEALNQIKGKIEEKIGNKEKKKISSGVNIGDEEEEKEDEDDEDDEDEGFGGYEEEEKLGSHNNSGANSDSKSNGAGSGDDSEKGSNSPSRLASDADKSKKKITKKSRKNRRSKKKATEPAIEYQSGNSTAHSGDESSGAKSDSSSKSNSGPKSGPVTISSHGPTPGLQDGTIELFGSRKICKYIAETYREYGYKSLLGEDPLARVSVEQWIQSEEQRFDPPSSALVFYLAYKIEQDDENATQSEKKLAKVLNLYEQRLGEFNFLAGDCFTLADLNHLPNTYFLEGSAEYGYLFKERKNVRKWWERISERAAWKNAVKKLKEEDILFNIPEAHSETNSSSSPSKNGFKKVPNENPERGSRQEKAKVGIQGNKTAPQSPPTDPGIESEKDGLKTGDKVKDPSGKGEEPDPNKKSENQSSAQQDDQVKKGTQSPNPGTEGKQVVDDKDKDSSGKESKPDLNKKKESSGTGEADNKGKKDSAPTDAGTERKKDGFKPDDKAKDPSVKGEEPDPNKKSENHSTTQLDDQGKKGVQPPTEGKKVVDDKDKASSGKENKTDLNKKKESSGTAEPDNKRKIDSAATDPGTEGKKNDLKPNDKVKTQSGKGEEPDPNNKNENQGTDKLDGQNKASSGNGDIPDPKKKEGSGPGEPDNQNKKGSAVTGVNGEISSGNNKNPNPMDDQGNKSSTEPDAKDKYSSGDNKKPNSTDDQANKGSAVPDANKENPNPTNPSFIDKGENK
ncbi:Glutathione S-transferase PARB [Platanthera zijinensis]|uniref:glutathione transferase n=1 Tax=Platanthera zijinensis TaxID=2320716 RepID=A0AAP0BXZ2_9ASPA